MKKALLNFFELLLISGLAGIIACSPQPANEQFVGKGTAISVVTLGNWPESDGALFASGENCCLIGGKTVETGDFRAMCRLSLDSLNGSNSCFSFFGNRFFFDAPSPEGKPQLLVTGPLFEKNQLLGDAGKLISPGKSFDFEIIKKGSVLTCLIDGKKICAAEAGSEWKGYLAVNPAKNTVRVSEFSMKGNLVPVEALSFLFESGQDGYHTFRIPAIVTTAKGTLLAFAEGRKNSRSDTGDIDMVLKRSEDGGKTWSPLSVIWDDAENVCGNPAPVVDKTTGTIFLLTTWNLGIDHEQEIIGQAGKDTRRVFVMQSVDDGITWTAPVEITQQVKPENWTWYATGPCHGIQIENGNFNGRLVIPCDHIEAGTKKYFSHIIYSDDHGKTWKIGGSTPQDQVNECTVAELPDGKLMLNMRNYNRTQKSRKISLSGDGGLSWGGIFPDTTLAEPICQGSLYRFSFGPSRLLFLNPADENSRQNMALRLSFDEGATWAKTKILHGGPSAYSDITGLPDGNIGCLYEAGYAHPYQGIVFKEILLNGLEK